MLDDQDNADWALVLLVLLLLLLLCFQKRGILFQLLHTHHALLLFLDLCHAAFPAFPIAADFPVVVVVAFIVVFVVAFPFVVDDGVACLLLLLVVRFAPIFFAFDFAIAP